MKSVVLPSPVEAVDLSVPSRMEFVPEPLHLRTPRGGWAQWALRVMPAGMSGQPTLRLPAFARTASVSAVNVYQVLSAPVDFDTAAYVRQSGEAGGIRSVPRVLFPLAVRPDGTVDLNTTRDPDHPADRAPPRPPRGPVLLWVEVRAAANAPPSDQAGSCDLLDGPNGTSLGGVAVTLNIADLSLPDAAHLTITAPLDWSALATLDPAPFATVSPRLVSRRDPATAAAVAQLDAYVRAAHDHRAGLFVDQLQPIVKWPPGRAPAVDWTDFDALVGPWLDGSLFPDRQPVGYWPVPNPDAIDSFDLAARAQYWGVAADHFDQRRWTAGNACPVVFHPDAPGPVTDAGAILLSAEARAALDSSPGVRALLPLRDDQLPLASPANPSLAQPAAADRLLTRAPGDVRTAAPAWPTGAALPAHYLDVTDPTGDTSPAVHGTGDEQDVRAAAWLAYLRDATVLVCGQPLPSTTSPLVPVRADELPWFYPASWYDADGPLPTLQLKWLRQAEQDYEVLRLAGTAGDRPAVLAVCRLIAKPVDLPPAAASDRTAVPPEVTLLGGATDPHACESTRDLLVDRLVSRRAATPAPGSGMTSLDLRTVRWFNAHQRPTAVATGVTWTWAQPDLLGQITAMKPPGPGSWITARLNVDVYDPADPPTAGDLNAAAVSSATWAGNTLRWQTAGGWEQRPPATYVPGVPACSVRPCPAVARFNLDTAGPAQPAPAVDTPARPPLSLSLVDGSDGQSVDCPLSLPIATCDRMTRPVALDGDLGDWDGADAAWLDRPLVRMSSRPAVQAGEARPADHPSSIYTNWTPDALYVGFKVAGAKTEAAARNFVEYRDGRAWGEDLCEVTVQPLYVDDTVGPTLHVVCKTGSEWAERQLPGGGAWQPFEGAALLYAAKVDADAGTWRGELSIPWASIVAPGRGRPSLLRFNFGHHVNATGESATWAGPVDQSRQTGMAGLLVVREAKN